MEIFSPPTYWFLFLNYITAFLRCSSYNSPFENTELNGFSTSISLCNRHHSQHLNVFIIPKDTPHPLYIVSIPQSLGNHFLFYFCIDLSLDIPYQLKHVIYSLFWLTSLTCHHVLSFIQIVTCTSNFFVVAEKCSIDGYETGWPKKGSSLPSSPCIPLKGNSS